MLVHTFLMRILLLKYFSKQEKYRVRGYKTFPCSTAYTHRLFKDFICFQTLRYCIYHAVNDIVFIMLINDIVFIMLINVKIVGILKFMSMINFMLS